MGFLEFWNRDAVYDALFTGPPIASLPSAPVVSEPEPTATMTLTESEFAARLIEGIPRIEVAALPGPDPVRLASFDGTKFFGGYGPTDVLTVDYWTLRARSVHLFQTNLYARGIIRRLVTNEINTGLHLEAIPFEKLLGLEEDALTDWSENVEDRFHLWQSEPFLCDHLEQSTFGALQAAARREALIAGDVLVVLRQDQRTGLPRIQLISADAVQNPWPPVKRDGARIEHGVEINDLGRHVAYWVRQRDGKHKRLPAWGEKTGRRLAWLIYGTDKRLDEVRGLPMLALVLQSLREIDRYRDSTQRKAVINSMIAMFIKKGEDKPGTRPITGGAIRRSEVVTEASGTAVTPRVHRTAELIPGMVLEELQHGEEPHAFPSTGTDEKFGAFEEVIIQAVAWGNEIPPEILRLSFSSNYSASQAAINEFKMYLNKVRTEFGQTFCQPIYVEWLLSEALARKIEAPRLLEAWRDPSQYDVVGAWTAADWAGHIKPAVDLTKLVKGYKDLIREGLITRDRAARELTGTKYSKNVQRLVRENELLFIAMERVAELESRAKTRLAAGGKAGDEDEEDNEDADDADDADERKTRKAG